ncbi:hypothetical protein HWV62_26356 [Athelia sp. TMB]|nr:hypothetical protein HWV62_26356 [Athelia sp. TMB]
MPDSVALVLLPPPDIAALIDPLRSANDKSYARGWSAHITILFPWAPTTDIDGLARALQNALCERDMEPFTVALNKVSRFATRDYETVYLGVQADQPIQDLWRLSAEVLDHPKDSRLYTPHMTLGQTARNPAAISFLTEKGNSILRKSNLRWQVDSVALMRRRQGEEIVELYMQIPLGRDGVFVPRPYGISTSCSYHFDGQVWAARQPTCTTSNATLSVATYNVLHDPSFPANARFSALRDVITEAGADIICLQEVTDDLLRDLMGDPTVRKTFGWSNRPANAVMESERNIVIFAREEFGFEATRVELGGNHKAAVIARIRTAQGLIALAGIHLTAGRSEPILEKKRLELSTLASYLRVHHEADEWVVAGDTNWPDSEPFPLEEELKDVWDMAGGGTYDPQTNVLAAATTRESRNPQRYDRILVKRGGTLSPLADTSRLFGIPPSGHSPASDHWGVATTLSLYNQATKVTSVPQMQVPPLSVLPTSTTTGELEALCDEHSCLPSAEYNQKLAHAVSTLQILLSDTPPTTSQATIATADDSTPIQPSPTNTSSVRFIVQPVGSFAMGYHNMSSDVDCVVVGNINSRTFWTLMRSKIRGAAIGEDGDIVRLRRFVKDASVQMMELDVNGIKMDVQYCPAGKLIDCWSTLSDIPRDSPLFALPVSVLRTLNAHRDAIALQKVLPSLDNFRLAHRSLKLFLRSHGLIGARFGFLGGFHLAFLLARVSILLPPSASPPQIIRVFFHTYARWDWERDMVTVPIAGIPPATYRRSAAREPLCILSIEKPMVNMTINGNLQSLAVLRQEFALADHNLEAGKSWKNICMGHEISPLMEFLKSHKAFAKIDINYWGSSCMSGRALVGWLESRFVNLLVHMHAEVPLLRARLWPFRLSESNVKDDRTLQGFYLIGLASNSNPQKTEEERKLMRQEQAKSLSSLTATLRTFESDLHQNSRYYDPAEAFISVAHIGSSQLSSSVVEDLHSWSDGGFDEDNNEDEDEDEDEDFPRDFEAPPSKKPEKAKTPHVLASKFNDYAIGYEDRFKGTYTPSRYHEDFVEGAHLGVKEMPLGAWKREVEDEAFVSNFGQLPSIIYAENSW